MKSILLFVCAVVLCSCAYATIEYDASTGSFAYCRMGDQELIDLYVKKDIDSTTVKLGKLQNESDVAEVLVGLEKNIDKALQILDELQKKVPGLF